MNDLTGSEAVLGQDRETDHRMRLCLGWEKRFYRLWKLLKDFWSSACRRVCRVLLAQAGAEVCF